MISKCNYLEAAARCVDIFVISMMCCMAGGGTDVLMSILARRKLYCRHTKSGPKLFVKKTSENQ